MGTESADRAGSAITLDDDYTGVYDEAFSVLGRYLFPAAIYLTTDAIGRNESRRSDHYASLLPGERMLSWSQCREMTKHGITIGSHLCHHLDMVSLSEVRAAGELSRSKFEIEDHLGMGCKHFAFPCGRYTRRVFEPGVGMWL